MRYVMSIKSVKAAMAAHESRWNCANEAYLPVKIVPPVRCRGWGCLLFRLAGEIKIGKSPMQQGLLRTL